MFILSCPSCGHRSKVKFARMGATAKCVACGEAFVVEAGTLEMQAKAGEGGEAKAAPPARVIEEPAPVQELVVERPPLAPPGNPIVGEGTYSSAPPPPRSFFRQLDPVLVGLFVMLLIGTAALLMVMLRGDDEDLSGDAPPPVAIDPQPAAPSPGTTPLTSDPSPATPPAVTQQNPLAPAPTSPAPQPAVDPAPNLPTMPLYGSLGYQPNWATIDPPREPAMPMMEDGSLLWLPRIEKQPDGSGLFTAIFMSDETMVYGSGFLQVQFINGEGKVYAEMKQTVPILPVRQAVEMRVPVSAAMMERFDRMVAEFTPLDPLEDAVPLELSASQTRVLSRSGDAPLIQVSLANPFSFAVSNPTIVLGILSAEGWPLGEWRGTMEGQIAAHGTVTFKASPPLAGDAQPARMVLRGFARKQ